MPRLRKTDQAQLALEGISAKASRSFATQQSLDRYIWSVCDILRRSNCAGALQYVPELTWILFLRVLDEREEIEASHAEAVGQPFTPSLAAPYRWRDWAAPDGPKRAAPNFSAARLAASSSSSMAICCRTCATYAARRRPPRART